MGTTILGGIRNAVSRGTQVTHSTDGKVPSGSDAVIVVIGEKPYAEMKGDRTDLRIAPEDAQLVAQAKAAGVPVITLLLSGRPLVLGPVLEASDAFVAAWLPGTEGDGASDVLFGDYPPTGKLSQTWPRTNEQVGVISTSADPALFPRDFGLTYSNNLKTASSK